MLILGGLFLIGAALLGLTSARRHREVGGGNWPENTPFRLRGTAEYYFRVQIFVSLAFLVLGTGMSALGVVGLLW
jgi:hypothetical protein